MFKDTEKVKAIISIEKIRFYRKSSNFGILVVSLDKQLEGKIKTDSEGLFVIKGVMSDPHKGGQYIFTGNYVEDPKWGGQYSIISMVNRMEDIMDDSGRKKYLSTIFTDTQFESLYNAFEDPYQILENKDIQQLIKIRGCGIKMATAWIEKFHQNKNRAKIFLELEEYELTNTMIDKLLTHYSNNADIVIQTIKENPYVLCNVNGIGFKTADEIALSGKIKEYSPIRIAAYMEYYLGLKGNEGNSYILSNELMDAIIEYFGEDIPDEAIVSGIKELGGKLWFSESKEYVGLTKYKKLEEKIAIELIWIRDALSYFECDDREECIRELELRQGWNYTEEQKKGINAALDNNVLLITGLAGSGKSSIVAGMLACLHDYSFAQCALAGKAAARLSEVTGKEGYTIHRLLGFPKGNADKGRFAYNDETPLNVDIIIVDEISMLDGQLFYNLIRSVRSGSKLIMLGDIGQLESIGSCNIAKDLLESPEIPSVELTEVHRQALDSGILTESRRIYAGEQIIEKDWTGTELRGLSADFELDCYSDTSNTAPKIIEYFKREIQFVDSIMDLQIIVGLKERGEASTHNLNTVIQEYYNPWTIGKKEVEIDYTGNRSSIIREGDKVICVRNNYDSIIYDPEVDYEECEDKDLVKYKTPVFNGNIGIVRGIKNYGYNQYMLISFVGIGNIVFFKKYYKSIELAYATTCHKNQGSEYKRVIFGVDFTQRLLLSKEFVYTGITRAKNHCVLVAQTSALRFAVSQHSTKNKLTHLKEEIKHVCYQNSII